MAKGNHQGTRWRGRLPIPPHAHPLVREFIKKANEENTTLQEIARKSGLSAGTLSGWRYLHAPRLDLFEAALNTLDYELRITPRKGVTP